eukprot:575165_1
MEFPQIWWMAEWEMEFPQIWWMAEWEMEFPRIWKVSHSRFVAEIRLTVALKEAALYRIQKDISLTRRRIEIGVRPRLVHVETVAEVSRGPLHKLRIHANRLI